MVRNISHCNHIMIRTESSFTDMRVLAVKNKKRGEISGGATVLKTGSICLHSERDRVSKLERERKREKKRGSKVFTLCSFRKDYVCFLFEKKRKNVPLIIS